MDSKRFDGEISYYLTMHYVNKMRNSGILSDDEYNKADAAMLKKYKPVIGSLLSDNYE